MTAQHDEPTIGVKLTTIYETVLRLEPLIPKVEDHGERLAKLENNDRLKELRITRVEVERAAEAKVASEKVTDARAKRPNWTAIAGFCLAGVLAVRDYIISLIN